MKAGAPAVYQALGGRGAKVFRRCEQIASAVISHHAVNGFTNRKSASLLALESLICQQAALIFQLAPGSFEIAKKQMKAGTQHPVFGGDDPVFSDLLSAELEQAMERLYKMIESHLGKAAPKPKKP